MGAWITPSGFLGTFTERVSTATKVIAVGTSTVYSLIAGTLPSGLNLSSTGTISGTPDPVLNTISSKFVVRAQELVSSPYGAITITFDRTFAMDVFGPSVPIWDLGQTTLSTSTRSVINNGITTTFVTTVPYINLGNNQNPVVLNNQYIDFQFTATTLNSPDNTVIQYYIPDGGGALPPGLNLSSTGRLRGILADRLTYDGNISPTGGYDSESFDGYTYDHESSTSTQLTGTPKSYKFYVTADDGISSSKQLFGILVTNPNMFRVDNTALLYNTSTFYGLSTTLTSSISSLQVPQFVNGSKLGTVRAGNNHEFNVSAYDPNPSSGPVIYKVRNGRKANQILPDGLRIDSTSGFIYGFIPYQPAYSRDYRITVEATKVSDKGFKATATNVFSFTIEGEVESTIKFVTTASLGTVYTGLLSEVSIKAKNVNSDYSVTYTLTDGILPSGLTLQEDGSISGRPTYESTGTYTFTVLAADVYGLSAVSREFNLTVIPYDSKKYTQIYVKPFMPLEMRDSYRNFITNTFTFDPQIMYRYLDPNFGVQNEVKMYLEFGIEKLNLRDYIPALAENFYRKRLYFGDVKLAYARDISGNVIYEVVYVDIVDDQINSTGQSSGPVLYTKNFNNVYYPSSISSMKTKLESLVLPNNTYIGVNQDSLPKFMETPQEGDYRPPGYMRVVPLCYVLPGNGAKILSRIKLSGFDFKLISFDVDRLIVQESLDNSTAKYVMFPRQTISDKLETDDILFGPDSVTGTQYITLVDLDTETGIPLTRV